VLPLSLSCDHRVVDGAEGARFLNTVVKLLESPDALLT
jgi:pyruvate dehydrogenase E2 component (dihydrolipoamide acetyltransferase)